MTANEFLVRHSLAADAEQICVVVRASIEHLCFADHHGQAAILDSWLANKTPANVARWLANPRNINIVAVDDSAVMGAGCVTIAGEVVLNYVSPIVRFRGVSSAILAALEEAAQRAGNTRCVLDSTRTAHEFYRARGYCDLESTKEKFGLATYPMMKLLV